LEKYKNVIVRDIFIIPPVLNLNFGAGAVGAEPHHVTLLWLYQNDAAPAPQHSKKHNRYDRIGFLNIQHTVDIFSKMSQTATVLE
jgi:hypothetical protein